MRVAAVDIGTNSCRLLVAEGSAAASGGRSAEGCTTLERRVRITRLGEDVDATGRLAEAAIARTVAAVTDYAAVWRSLGAEAVRITATSAARDSANAADFATAVHEVTGVVPEVLSGAAEAASAYRGALSGLPDVPIPAVVLDIGGGSTELVLGGAGSLRSTSRQLGCVRLRERILLGDPPTAAEVTAARALIAEQLDAAEVAVDPAAGASLIAVAGTATTIAALHLGLPSHRWGTVHGAAIPAAAVRGWADRLIGMSASAIGALGPVEAGREDVLAGGALILAEVVSRFGFTEVLVSETDILDGLVLGLLDGAGDDSRDHTADGAPP